MCAGLPSRLDLYHDLARVQERVLHLEQENAALRAACASAAAGRSADALECGDGHGENESLAQEDYGEGTARMEEVPMDEGWMHLKRAVDRDRAFVDFRRLRSSVNAVTINPSDNAFAQYNADLDRGLHNEAQACMSVPGVRWKTRRNSAVCCAGWSEAYLRRPPASATLCASLSSTGNQYPFRRAYIGDVIMGRSVPYWVDRQGAGAVTYVLWDAQVLV